MLRLKGVLSGNLRFYWEVERRFIFNLLSSVEICSPFLKCLDQPLGAPVTICAVVDWLGLSPVYCTVDIQAGINVARLCAKMHFLANIWRTISVINFRMFVVENFLPQSPRYGLRPPMERCELSACQTSLLLMHLFGETQKMCKNKVC